MPELRDVSTDQQDKGWKRTSQIDRDTAARMGVTSAAIDSALYDAFGQRQVSTIYPALNQYHVVMEVDPRFSGTRTRSNISMSALQQHGRGALSSFAAFQQSHIPLWASITRARFLR